MLFAARGGLRRGVARERFRRFFSSSEVASLRESETAVSTGLEVNAAAFAQPKGRMEVEDLIRSRGKGSLGGRTRSGGGF